MPLARRERHLHHRPRRQLPVAIKNAIRVACESIQHQVNPHIIEAVQRYHDIIRSPDTRTHQPKRTVRSSAPAATCRRRVLTNAELEKMVETSDEWITTRTGIKERRIAAEGEYTSDLAAKAALAAMENAGITADEIDLIIVATVTPDMFFPSTACFVQTEDRREERRVFRRQRRLLRLSLRARDRAAVHHVAHLQHHPRHRRGKASSDRRLDGSQHLRALRRRRRRGRSCGIAAAATA